MAGDKQRNMNNEVLKFNIIGTTLVGLNARGSRSLVHLIYTCFWCIMFILYDIAATVNFIKCGSSIICICENLGFSLVIITTQFLYFIFFFKEESYQNMCLKLIKLMDEFDTEVYTMRVEKTLRRFTVFLTLYSVVGISELHIMSVVDYKYCIKRDLEYSAFTCGLPTPAEFPFNATVTPGYEIAFASLAVWNSMCIIGSVQPFAFSVGIIYHIIGHLKMLQDKIKNIKNIEVELRYKYLQDIVVHHAAVLDFGILVGYNFNVLMVFTAVLTTIVISISGFQILKMLVTVIVYGELLGHIGIMFGYLITVACISLIGQLLIDESTAISTSAYETDWYSESVRFQKMILLIMMRSNKPLVLRSASITVMSLVSFSQVMSTTYSYLMMLYNMVLMQQEEE